VSHTRDLTRLLRTRFFVDHHLHFDLVRNDGVVNNFLGWNILLGLSRVTKRLRAELLDLRNG
jgi:hypothetical protein